MRREFMSVQMQQNQFSIPTFDEFFSRIGKVNQIMELGTGSKGGLAIFLRLYSLCSNATFITIDARTDGDHYDILKMLETDMRHFMIFDEKNIAFISDFISQEGKTVLLCDNGNKIKEFNTFVPKLKFGDFVLVHDFCDDSGERKKHWPHCEVFYDDIKETASKCNLEIFMEDEFSKCGWICFSKIG